jgi:hypothetical protein
MSSSSDSSSNDSTFYDEEESSMLGMLISSDGQPIADIMKDMSESLKMISKHLCNQNRILIKIGTLLDAEEDE